MKKHFSIFFHYYFLSSFYLVIIRVKYLYNLSCQLFLLRPVSYYFQLNDPTFQQWIWQVAIDNQFNCDKYLTQPDAFLKTVPRMYDEYLPIISPKTHAIIKNSKNLDHFYGIDPTLKSFPSEISKSDMSVLTRFYNDYQKVPYKETKKVIRSIFPYMKVSSHQSYLDLIPHLTMSQQLDLIGRFPFQD